MSSWRADLGDLGIHHATGACHYGVFRLSTAPKEGPVNKAELVNAVAEKSGQPAAAVGSVIAAFEEVITSAVASGDKVQMPGFLSFERADRAARTGRNPATGAEIQIAAATVPKVKVGKSFKDAVK
jgi:DNA-binding protein HU-beta